MSKLKVKKFGKPDELAVFDHGKASTLNLNGAKVVRRTFEPGWKWSKHMKPRAKLCYATHFNYHASGVMHISMEDGSEADVGPGEVVWIPPGHDAWVVGVEPVVVVDIQGMVDSAKTKRGSKR
jgi:quercetin dioxygenase-like cupin family protein